MEIRIKGKKKIHTQFDVVRLVEVYTNFCEVFIIAPRLVGEIVLKIV